MADPPPLPWGTAAPVNPPETPSIRAGQKIEVLWQLLDDDEEEEEEDGEQKRIPSPSRAATAMATGEGEGGEGGGEAGAQTTKEPRHVWWGATIESVVEGGEGTGTGGEEGKEDSAPALRATIRYEAAHGFESETAVVEFPFSSSSSSSSVSGERTLRNVAADGVAVAAADEPALSWRFLGETVVEDEEGVDEEEEGDEDEMEVGGATGAAGDAVQGSESEEITACDLEKALSAQVGSLERATGLRAEAAASAALLARAGGSVAAANEVASRFESFAGLLREKLAAAARANGGAALGEEDVRAAVAEARRQGGGSGGAR